MVRPEPIGKVLSPRAARARRACEQWAAEHDARGCTMELLVVKATESAEHLSRDLTPSEVNAVCTAAVAAYVDDEEQAAAEAAIASARREREAVEQEARARYSAECAAAWRRGEPTPDPPRPGAVVYTIDPRGPR